MQSLLKDVIIVHSWKRATLVLLFFFHDGSNMKTVFAYGVLEVNELNVAGDDDEDDLRFVYPGPFSICLRLNTAVENLHLKEGACVNDCGEGC